MKIGIIILCLLANISAFGFDWDQKADFGGVARHRSTALAIGNKVYFGLGHYNGAGPNVLFDDWWEYDPATNAWTQKANYLGGQMYHAAGFTIGSIGYVGTGRDISSILVSTFFSYDPATNAWTQEQNFPGVGRRGAVGFSIGDYGYIGTGSNYSDFYKFDPSNGSWSAVASIPTSGRISAVGFELDGYGYVGTGTIFSASNDFWQYNPTSNSWTQMADVGPTPRQEAAGFAVNGRGYILTGDDYSSGNNYGDMWEYLPTTNTWTQVDDFPGSARRYLTCVTLGNMAYAGLGTNGTNFKDFWQYDQAASLLERNLDHISVSTYPNPSTDYVNFEFKGIEGVSLSELKFSINSITGQQLYLENLTSESLTVETEKFGKGTYFYSLAYKDMQLKTGQFIVR